ncbi:ricin-type beta-trefoil lectin domain protein [Glycomyces harbinensis]|uniref:Cellulase (Glycosyl hydrolase family 5) n=1 Tax=Glycomyces harbinensis TaxID=58114 RepID=A0A1G6WVH7_9ACTN|nr:ricin-type beta-trefoil lectin domain protein [Glycomyces harbinensis]SDD69804.1 Cellulase (glycosyl hydrolase family 5) [Glycomyces harbinensis]
MNPGSQRKNASSPRRRSLLRLVIGTLAALALVPLTVLAGAAPANADTGQFRGVNWAVLGDNFSTGPLVIQGLSSSDSYSTVRAKADALYDDMEAALGVNTIRLPINTHTVGTSWWNNYRGAIDAATDRGFNVILAYWEDGAASGGRITDMSAFNAMWNTVVSQYSGNSRVHFEPMNEPHGYSAGEWLNVAADWISARPSIPKGRILIGGTGFSQDLRPVCNDSRFNGTLLSFHSYAFFYGENTYAGWRSNVETRLGACASRAVATEFGAPMNNGLNYSDAASTDNFVRYIRALTDVMRDNGMGGTYWPALGGKPGTIGYDWYSMFALQGSGTDLSLTIRNSTGADRLRHAWGDDVGSGQATDVVNRNSGRCVDVVSASTANGAEIIQWDCHGGSNQQWLLQDVGGGHVQIVSPASGKCLDVDAASTADNARVLLWSCNGGANQQWQLRAVSGGHVEIVARHSGKCLDVAGSSTANSARLQHNTCRGSASQQWTV